MYGNRPQESQAEGLVAELTEVVRRQKAKIEALQKEREEAEPRRGVSSRKHFGSDRFART